MHKITTVFNYFTAVIINMFANNRMSCVSSKWQKKAAACFDGGSLREAQEGKYDTLEDVPRSTPRYLKVLDPVRAKTLDAKA